MVEDLKKKVPKIAAVTVRVTLDLTVMLLVIMRRITVGVDIKTLIIEGLNVRMSLAGRITLVVMKDEEAAILAEKLQVMVSVNGKVSRPTTTASLLDVLQWITAKDVQDAQLFAETTSPHVTIRPILSNARGAAEIGEASDLQVEWSRCRVRVLGKRPTPTRYWCQDRGRVQESGTATTLLSVQQRETPRRK